MTLVLKQMKMPVQKLTKKGMKYYDIGKSRHKLSQPRKYTVTEKGKTRR